MVDIRITDVKTLRVRGPITYEGGGEYWEERLVQPIDIYPDYKGAIPWDEATGSHAKVSPNQVEVEGSWLEIETDSGLKGIVNWIPPAVAYICRNVLKPILVGQDPVAVEKIWDQLYRTQVHGRKCDTMLAISAVDCAIWDIIGKMRDEPVYRLLGGPVKEKIRAYASCLGWSLKPELVVKRAQMYLDQGYTAMKWFFRHGPSDGVKGEKENIRLVKTLRDAVGYDVDIMLDCWMSWNVKYTIKMARKLARYEPTWLEEPVMGDMIDEMEYITRNVDIPISGAEHEYTRWGFSQLVKRRALDVIQPDVSWAGGISETKKICTISSTAGIPVIPHSGNAPIAQHIWFSQNVEVVPLAEYLVKWNPWIQAHNKQVLQPVKGYIYPTKKPGLGIELDEEKITSKVYDP
jgi:L-alanine-DL-glutamate epimerase-like enolase superfamily enzyme